LNRSRLKQFPIPELVLLGLVFIVFIGWTGA
jgi:hypothetical protein